MIDIVFFLIPRGGKYPLPPPLNETLVVAFRIQHLYIRVTVFMETAMCEKPSCLGAPVFGVGLLHDGRASNKKIEDRCRLCLSFSFSNRLPDYETIL